MFLFGADLNSVLSVKRGLFLSTDIHWPIVSTCTFIASGELTFLVKQVKGVFVHVDLSVQILFGLAKLFV